jgi:RNA polymerase sigma factor (TIGR02999 family)
MNEPARGDVTQLLLEWSAGREDAIEDLMSAVYTELHRLAASYMRGERPDHTLQSTGLVHEAYMRLVDQNRVAWQNRAHFFGIAAQMMRRILVDHARKRQASKRGGGETPLSLAEELVASAENADNVDIMALDRVLTDLEKLDERQARIVELRFFVGMSVEEIAHLLETSPSTVKREWRLARMWLQREIERA